MSEKTRTTTASETPVVADPALIVDIRGVFDRGWHASRTSEELAHLDSSHAAACAALMVLLPILGSGRLDEQYKRCLFAWDGGFHKTDKPRKPKPDNFREDLAYFKYILPALVGGAHFTAGDAEADDVVSTVAVRLSEGGTHCCVVSGDKDLQQLSNRMVTYYCLNKKSILSSQHIMDKWNINHPSHLAVRLAVEGDPGDGINGVDRWGKKAWDDRIMKGAAAKIELSDLIGRVEDLIPKEQLPNFRASIDATLLRVDVPGVPDPEPLHSAPMAVLEDEGLDHTRNLYARFIGDLSGDTAADSVSDVDREY